jgi:RNA polymerase sigma-70 factor (ECF subfamily)
MADASENLEVLVNAHSREVYSLLLAVTGNPATAEELTQDVFLVALRKGMRPGPGMRLWLREVARRLAMNELRRKRPESVDLAASEPAGPGGPGGPAERASFDEELAALRRCLESLAGDDRQLLAARYERGESVEALAAALAQSMGYLKQRLFRLRKRLADCVRKRLGESEVARG